MRVTSSLSLYQNAVLHQVIERFFSDRKYFEVGEKSCNLKWYCLEYNLNLFS